MVIWFFTPVQFLFFAVGAMIALWTRGKHVPLRTTASRAAGVTAGMAVCLLLHNRRCPYATNSSHFAPGLLGGIRRGRARVRVSKSSNRVRSDRPYLQSASFRGVAVRLRWWSRRHKTVACESLSSLAHAPVRGHMEF
jgi:hypothetical protein